MNKPDRDEVERGNELLNKMGEMSMAEIEALLGRLEINRNDIEKYVSRDQMARHAVRHLSYADKINAAHGKMNAMIEEKAFGFCQT